MKCCSSTIGVPTGLPKRRQAKRIPPTSTNRVAAVEQLVERGGNLGERVVVRHWRLAGVGSLQFRRRMGLAVHGLLLWLGLRRGWWLRLDRSAAAVNGDGGAGDVARSSGDEEGDDLGDLLWL